MQNISAAQALQNLEKLGHILPENRQQGAHIGKTPKLVSTDQVVETNPFPTADYASAMQAAAASESEHLNMLAPISGMDPILRVKDELAGVASQLRTVRLPDTKVSIHQERIEIPHAVKQYANELDQAQYIKFMMILLGKEKLYQVLRHSRKANQNTTPALWFNQQIVVETKKRSVYTLNQHVPEDLHDPLGPQHERIVVEALDFCLGKELLGALMHVAEANRLNLYVVLIMITDTIFSASEAASVAVTQASIWDGVIEEFESEQSKPDNTAVEALRNS